MSEAGRIPDTKFADHQPKYWTGTGRFQEIQNRLYPILVPQNREPETEIGCMLCFVNNIYYDIYNNGGCNLGQVRFRYAGIYLEYHFDSERFSAAMAECGVNYPCGFSRVIRRFARGKATMEENDFVVDVFLKYIDGEYQKTISENSQRN